MRIALFGFGLLLLAGCAAAAPEPQPAAAAAAPEPQPAAAAAGPATYQNPILNQDFPDPDILKVGDTYHAYATNTDGANIQTAYSSNLVDWKRGADALPAMPRWARAGLTWAPEVTTLDDGATFLLYFVARDLASDKQCIGLATSSAPEGPFVDNGDAPFICNPAEGGDIDPATFVDDDGTPWLLWKNDGNCCDMDTWIYIQQLAPDGRRLVGEPTRLIKQDQRWEGNLVEAPTLWKQDGRYYLFYSANNYADNHYAIGYAVADAPTGPFVKDPNRLAYSATKNGRVTGPGGQDVVIAPNGRTYLVYHSWADNMSYRRMNMDELRWENGVPRATVTSGIPQPRP